MKTIEIIVSPTGQTRVETKGFTGSECREASRFIEQALGRRTSEQLTSEFHEQQPQHQTLQEGTRWLHRAVVSCGPRSHRLPIRAAAPDAIGSGHGWRRNVPA